MVEHHLVFEADEGLERYLVPVPNRHLQVREVFEQYGFWTGRFLGQLSACLGLRSRRDHSSTWSRRQRTQKLFKSSAFKLICHLVLKFK